MRRKDFDLFALGPSAILYYGVLFYLAPLLTLLGLRIKGLEFNFHALDPRTLPYLALGLAGLAIGSLLPYGNRAAKKMPEFLHAPWDMRRAEIAFFASFGLGLVAKMVRMLFGGYFHLGVSPAFASSSFYSAVGFLDWLGPIAMVIAFLAASTGEKEGLPHRRFTSYAWIAFALEVAYALPTCSRFKVITPLMLLLLVSWYTRGRSYWKVVATGVLVAGLLFPFGNACRNPKQLAAFHIVESGAVQLHNVPAYAEHAFIARTNQSLLFSKILEADAPLLLGKSLKNFLIALGPPKFIWKHKPATNAGGNEFGRRIGVLSDDDWTTSVGPTLPGDWYMNFGLFGLFFGMMAMGWLWSFLYAYSISREDPSSGGLLLYAFLWLHIVRGMEDAIAPVYAGLVKLVVLLLLIQWCIRSREFPRSRAEAPGKTA